MAQQIVDGRLSGLVVGEGMPFHLGADHPVDYRAREVERPEPGSPWNSIAPKLVLSTAAAVALIAAFWPEPLTDKPKTEARAPRIIGASALAK